MNKNRKRIFLSFIFTPVILFSLPLSYFSIKADGVDPAVYTENFSYFKLLNKNKNFNFPETVNQKIISKKNKDLFSETIIKSGNFWRKNKPSQKYISDTPLLNINDKMIVSVAKQLKQSANPLTEVSKFVFKHIKDKIIGIPIISASSVIRNRSGDCTEHAVLTTSLLRAMKIPARAVMGMILVSEISGNRNTMVYHMWSEAYYKGKWRIIDSTRTDKIKGNRYIAFCYHDLKTEMPREYMNSISSISDLRVIYIKKNSKNKL